METKNGYEGKQSDQFLQDKIFSSQADLTFDNFLEKSSSLSDHISDEFLYEQLKTLSDKQLKILELIYFYNLNNKEIAKILGESEQTISYNHKSALKKGSVNNFV